MRSLVLKFVDQSMKICVTVIFTVQRYEEIAHELKPYVFGGFFWLYLPNYPVDGLRRSLLLLLGSK